MASKPDQQGSSFYEEAYYRVAPQQLSAERLNAELELIARALELPAGGRLLDLGCGYGRHAIPLSRRGYEVTGVDLSRTSLREARRSAREAAVRVRWLRRDMRALPYANEFHGAICMGAFGALDDDNEDLRVLFAVRRALRHGGRFLLDHKNREWQVQHLQPAGRLELPDGAVSEWRVQLDLAGGYRWDYEVFTEVDGVRREYTVRERLYTLEEVEHMLSRAGPTLRCAWGDYATGELGPDSPRMIVLAEKA